MVYPHDKPRCWHTTKTRHNSLVTGKNATNYVYPGPIAIDTTAKKPKDKPESSKPSQESALGPSFPWPMAPPTATHPPQPVMPPNSDVVHYPMDPGHPTIPYMGPYNPDFKPTQPSVEELFHLPSHAEKAPPIKEKSKSKSDSKKPVDSFKSHKDGIADQFPGPLAPDRFPDKPHPSEKPSLPPLSRPVNPNKLPGLSKDHVEQPQFIPLNVHDHVSGPTFDFAPSNGENLPPSHFDTLLENPAAGPPYGDGPPIGSRPESSNDPNNVVPSAPKKKVPGSDIYPSEKGKPSSSGLPPKRPDLAVPSRNPSENIPDELYHLINLQHPGLIQLNHGPPNAHPGLYDIQQEIASGDNKAPAPVPSPPNYFGPVKSKPGKPQIFTQKDENGQTTYHVHAAEVPNSPQQLEELLAHIAQHDPNNNPYQQHYPVAGQQPTNVPAPQPGLPPQQQHPLDVDSSLQQQQQQVVQAGGVPVHLGPHGFVAQAPPAPGQSGSFLSDHPRIDTRDLGLLIISISRYRASLYYIVIADRQIVYHRKVS